jgi:hypothetical protein
MWKRLRTSSMHSLFGWAEWILRVLLLLPKLRSPVPTAAVGLLGQRAALLKAFSPISSVMRNSLLPLLDKWPMALLEELGEAGENEHFCRNA